MGVQGVLGAEMKNLRDNPRAFADAVDWLQDRQLREYLDERYEQEGDGDNEEVWVD